MMCLHFIYLFLSLLGLHFCSVFISTICPISLILENFSWTLENFLLRDSCISTFPFPFFRVQFIPTYVHRVPKHSALPSDLRLCSIRDVGKKEVGDLYTFLMQLLLSGVFLRSLTQPHVFLERICWDLWNQILFPLQFTRIFLLSC